MTFEEARARGLSTLGDGNTIGVLNERSLHAIFKFWLDPDETHHEVPLPCGAVADIFDGQRVTEIQTANFSHFRQKLQKVLEDHEVTVVYPVTRKKQLIWIDPETGVTTPPRKSPRVGNFADIGRELVCLVPLLGHPRLTFVLQEVDVEEYRMQDGWGNGGKRGSHRAERIPTALGASLTIKTIGDWNGILPPTLGEIFTVAEVQKAARLSRQKAQACVAALYKIGALTRDGKRGNAYVYKKGE